VAIETNDALDEAFASNRDVRHTRSVFRGDTGPRAQRENRLVDHRQRRRRLVATDPSDVGLRLVKAIEAQLGQLPAAAGAINPLLCGLDRRRYSGVTTRRVTTLPGQLGVDALPFELEDAIETAARDSVQDANAMHRGGPERTEEIEIGCLQVGRGHLREHHAG
jgi:hypothetical protein